MTHLLRFLLLHLTRTRLIYFAVFLAAVLHFVVLKIVDAAFIYVSGFEFVGPQQVLLGLLWIQLMIGGFVAMVYGVWNVPYLHRGSVAPLTYPLPIAKWKYPIAYALCLLLLLIVLDIIMYGLQGAVYGYTEFGDSGMPWRGLLFHQVRQWIAIVTTMFLFAVFSLFLGKVASIFLGSVISFLMQVGGAFFDSPLAVAWEADSWVVRVLHGLYRVLPPVSSVTPSLKQLSAPAPESGLLAWVAWCLALMVAFQWGLRVPLRRLGK